MKVTFISANRKAVCSPDPAHPNGIAIDIGERPSCKVELPYPAECIGTWLIECDKCGTGIAVTAAGRPDDPISVEVPCRGG